MLKKFTVNAFKNFSNACSLDLTKIRDYDFNKQLIKNGIINKVLLYGKNGSGKSNLGLAIMDISIHLSDNQRNMNLYSFSLNGDSSLNRMTFEYIFDFNGKEVTYRYSKNEMMMLLDEQIAVNGKIVFEYNYQNNAFQTKLPELETFNQELLIRRNLNTSVIKMIYGYSSSLPNDSPIKNLCEFANNMLWFRSLMGNQFMGNINQVEDFEQFIIGLGDKGLKDFEKFLSDCGLNYKLKIDEFGMGRRVFAVFKNRQYPLISIASTGTKSLWLFYYWMKRCDGHISFLFLDEFDAFYHSSLSLKVLQTILFQDSFQSIITTHNTYLADNSIMRPDCYLIIKDNEIKSFADRTTKTIREGNNLEKMMLSEEFE